MKPHEITARITAAIQPALDRADALLDHYTDGLPASTWRPIADRLNPAIGVIYIGILPKLHRAAA